VILLIFNPNKDLNFDKSQNLIILIHLLSW